MLLFYLIKESFLYAINSLYINKLRTILSLLGITIGIFAIISVFTVINSLENSIKTSINSLGENVVYIQKWPWIFGGDYPWWDFIKRPVPTVKEVKPIIERSNNVLAAVFMLDFNANVQFEDNLAESVRVVATQQDYEKIKNFDISQGRFFSLYETETGKNKAVMGYSIAKTLFLDKSPIGEIIKINGHKISVVGVFDKEGDDIFGMSNDNSVFIPVNYAKNIINIKKDNFDPMIMVEAKENIGIDELIDELQGVMRTVRRLKPTEEDDFALNKASLITQGFKSIFKIIDIVGWIIGGFSILVGGFGIANIMFVSVKEQTKIIGIQKALGAKRYFILLQFLFEAVSLAVIGGTLGLILIFLLTLILNSVSAMQFNLTIGSVSFGLLLSIIIGIVSGIIPAMKASKLNPVDAINHL